MQYKNDEQANFPFEISRTHKVNGRETNACDANDMKCTGQMMNMSGKIVVFKDVCCFFVCVLLTELFCWLAYGFNRWSVCAWRVCVCVYVIESVPFVIHFHTTPTQLNQLINTYLCLRSMYLWWFLLLLFSCLFSSLSLQPRPKWNAYA